jgi:hypothetical protein
MLQDSQLRQRTGRERQRTIVREQTTIAMFRGRAFRTPIVRERRTTSREHPKTIARERRTTTREHPKTIAREQITIAVLRESLLLR